MSNQPSWQLTVDWCRNRACILLKEETPGGILAAVSQVAAGGQWFPLGGLDGGPQPD
jgi:hypothetical protein